MKKTLSIILAFALVIGVFITSRVVSHAEDEAESTFPDFEYPTGTKTDFSEYNIPVDEILAFFPETIDMKYEDGVFTATDFGAQTATVLEYASFMETSLTLVDGVWTAEVELDTSDQIAVHFMGSTGDKNWYASYIDGRPNGSIRIENNDDSIILHFSSMGYSDSVRYEGGKYSIDDSYADGALEFHSVFAEIENSEDWVNVRYNPDGSLNIVEVYVEGEGFFHYFPEGWSQGYFEYVEGGAIAPGYEDYTEEDFKALAPSQIGVPYEFETPEEPDTGVLKVGDSFYYRPEIGENIDYVGFFAYNEDATAITDYYPLMSAGEDGIFSIVIPEGTFAFYIVVVYNDGSSVDDMEINPLFSLTLLFETEGNLYDSTTDSWSSYDPSMPDIEYPAISIPETIPETLAEVGIDNAAIWNSVPAELEATYENGILKIKDVGFSYIGIHAYYNYTWYYPVLEDGYYVVEIPEEAYYGDDCDVSITLGGLDVSYCDMKLSSIGLYDDLIENSQIDSKYIHLTGAGELLIGYWLTNDMSIAAYYEDGVYSEGYAQKDWDQISITNYYDYDGRFLYTSHADYEISSWTYYLSGQGWSGYYPDYVPTDAPEALKDYTVGQLMALAPSFGLCDHSWVDANCLAARSCEKCGLWDGELGDHTWVDATCDTPKTCEVCDLTEGEALGHKWVDATYDSPKSCERCDATEGEPLPRPEEPEEPETPVEPDLPAEPETDHTACESNWFGRIWNAVVNFFRRLFGKPELCVCGKELV